MDPGPPCPEARALAVLADHLHEEVLLRIGAPADLARASAGCKAFRRLITDPAFLRRYRSLHPPVLLGFVGPMPSLGFLRAEAPHPHAPAARAFAAAADFSFDHLPHSVKRGWARYDAREGRVLLMRSDLERRLVSPDLAVCDPLTWGHTLLPPIPIPEDLLASVQVQGQNEYVDFVDAFFDPSGQIEEAHFRVFCWINCFPMAAVFVYSSVSGSWTHAPFISWPALGLQPEDLREMCQWHGYAHGCLYWDAGISNKMVKLDINTMEFTTVSLPSNHKYWNTVFVEAGEGRIGMFNYSRAYDGQHLMRYSVSQNESKNFNEHVAETTIPLACAYEYCRFNGATQGYIFMIGKWDGRMDMSSLFSLEIKTQKIERIFLPNGIPHRIIPYFGFPPFMSPRRM